MIDLDDITGCPLADRCATCGRTSDLHICTYSHPLGVSCRTVCGSCCRHTAPPMSLAAAQLAVLEHCAHLGITTDQMRSVLAVEDC